jgi:hypothetical protein
MKRGGECDHLPSRAFASVGPRDGFITIQERARSKSQNYPPKPYFEFSDKPGAFSCAPNGLKAQEFVFRDAGRFFYAFTALGDAGPEAELESVLNSFDASGRVVEE